MTVEKIWIDAGHGNKDAGAVFGKRLEAEDNLKLARAVEPFFRARGFETGMTRTANDFKGSRVTAAVNFGADLYLSLHRNDDENKQGAGYETLTKVSFSAADNALAQAVHRRMVEAGVQRNRGVKRKNLQTLAALPAKMAACTLEVGFIHNARDNQLFDKQLQQYARAIVQGVIDVYGAPLPESAPHKFTTKDAAKILRHVAGLEALSFEETKLYNFGGNGEITTANARRVLRIIAGLDPDAAPKITFGVGDRVTIAAVYAASAFDAVARSTAMVGAERFITKIHLQSGVNFAYQLGVKPGDTSAKNTTGFANAGGILKA
jgi:N-acetylmuramoyl-L-alanine amidase